jgi:hypothetical protein
MTGLLEFTMIVQKSHEQQASSAKEVQSALRLTVGATNIHFEL